MVSVRKGLIYWFRRKNAPIVGIAFNWFIIRVAVNKAEVAKAQIPENVSTLMFNRPSAMGHETKIDGANAAVSAGAVFEIVMCVPPYAEKLRLPG